MKILKKVLIILAAFIVLWLIVAAFVSGNCKYEKSISINATPEKVWQNTNSLQAMDKWSPWNELDPKMKKTWTGKIGQSNEKLCWESNKGEAGKGCQEVVKIDSYNKKIETKIVFLTPYESEANAFVIVVPENGGSKATWGFTSEIPYPFTVIKLFMNLEDAIGKDYQKGLTNLKTLSESSK